LKKLGFEKMREKVEEIVNGLSVSRDVKLSSRRYQKIVSVPKDDSHLQSVHLDFAPVNPDSIIHPARAE